MAPMPTVSDNALFQRVARFFERPDIRGNLMFLRRRLPASAVMVVAGGAVRNIVIDALHGHPPPTRDIDIFLGGLDPDFSLTGALGDQKVDQLDLKGVRWHPASSGLAYDICLLSDFLIISTYHLDATLENLLFGIDFTINAILYDVQGRTLVENGCRAAVRTRRIDFNSPRIPDKCLIAYRILLMGHKTGFTFAAPVFAYLRNRLELETVTRLDHLLRAKVGKTEAAAIMAEYDALCRHHAYEDYLESRQRPETDA